MKKTCLLAIISLFTILVKGQSLTDSSNVQVELNKKAALNFYQDLWASDNTDKYKDYVAEEYVVHDIGDRKGVTESALEQKSIADLFWDGGSNKVTIDYQIAEGDLVATRWIFDHEPESFLNKVLFGTKPIPIINVFRFKEGKIVEIWNHRHDIDTNQTGKFTIKGLLIGLIIALIPTVIAIRLKRKLKRLSAS